MRHILLGVLVLALHAAPRAAQQDAAPDAVARLLAAVETAIAASTDEAFTRLATPSLAGSAAHFWADTRGGRRSGALRAVVRERERRLGSGAHLVVAADLFVSAGRGGVVTTFEAELRPRTAGGLEIVALKSLAHLDGLTRLVLDTEQQFAVHDLTVTAPDLTITMASGDAFGASTESGLTVLVLRGRADLRFTPPDVAEQDQLRILTRRPVLETAVEDLVIRLNPGDLAAHLSTGSLTTTTRDARAAARAQEVFDRTIARTYSINLGDLSADRWALLPPRGTLAIEFRSPRYGWWTYVRSLDEPEDVTLFDRERRLNISQYASKEHVGRRGRFFDEDANAAYDIVHYDLDLAFEPARDWIRGRGALTVRVLADVARTLSFRLAESLTISSVTSPQLGRLLALRVVDHTTVVVGLPKALVRGDEITIEFAYSGRVEPEVLGSETAVLQSASVPADIPPFQRPEPQWLYSNRAYWYPQGLLTDYAPATLRLRVPPPYDVVASGVRSPASDADVGERVVTFVSTRPIRYLAVEISRFVTLGDATSAAPAGVDVTTLSTPRRAGANRGLPGTASEIVGYYARTFGEAPYPHLTVTAVDALMPGGHGPAYVAVVQQPLPMTPYAWRDDPLSFDRYPDFILAHEIAHQWWGQAVGFKSYHDQWLSEGLAQYSALAFAGVARPDLERSLITRMRESAESLGSSGPIHLGYRLGHIEGRGAPFRAVVYNKSAVVLHMLRRLVGDEPFRRGLARFYRDWRFKKAGTDDLRLAFEAETGHSLTRFFDRWVLGSTVPRLRVTSRVDRVEGFAEIRLEQMGETFDLPLTVELQYADGKTDEVTLSIREAVVDARIPIKEGLRRIVTKDERTLAEYVN